MWALLERLAMSRSKTLSTEDKKGKHTCETVIDEPLKSQGQKVKARSL